MDQKYEDCWSMMFHACSVSYSIGLHIVGQYKTDEAKSNKNIYALASNTEDSDNSDKNPQIYLMVILVLKMTIMPMCQDFVFGML